MSTVRELPILSTLRGDLQEDGAIEELAQDLINDLNTIAAQWNSNVYPLLATLPDGPVKKVRGDRSEKINPITNGFDGSQIFVDQTSRPEEFNGLLHNGARPKTIKEVLLETYQSILARQNSIESLLEDLPGAAEEYDDAQLRSWILKLAAETWDPDEIALGATLNTGNFAGAPVKGSTYSLNTRDKNLRNIIGIEGESLGLTEIDSLLAGANFISADTDLIAALLTLDGVISGMGGAITLQDAYDSSGAGTRRIEELSADPIEIIADTGNDNALVLRGGIQLIDTIDATPEEDVFWIGPEHSGDADSGQFDLKIFVPDNSAVANEVVRFSVNKGNTIDPEDEIVELFLGKVTADADLQRGALYIGRETVGAGGEPHLTIDSYDNGGTETARITSPLTVFELSAVAGNLNFSWDVDFICDTDFLLRGGAVTIEANVTDITAQAINDIFIQAANELTIDTNTLGGGDITLHSNAVLDIDAETGITIDTATNAIEIASADTDENSFIHITSNGIGVGDLDAQRIESYIRSTGANHDVEIRSDNATAVVAGEEVLLTSNGNVHIAGDAFAFISTDWSTGVGFFDETSIPTEGSLLHLLGSGERGKIFTVTDGFSNTKYQSVASSTTRLVYEGGAFRALANAPTTKGAGATTYGAGIVAGAGAPDIDTLYRENVVKSKGKIFVDVSKIGTINSNDGGILDSFNILGNDIAGSQWDGGGGLNIVFLTPMPDNSYSVTFNFSSSSGEVIMGVITEGSVNSTGFTINCYRWNSGGTSWDLITDSDSDFYCYFQVV